MDRARRGARCQAVNEGALQRSTQVKHIMERCVATFHSMFHSRFAVVLLRTERSC